MSHLSQALLMTAKMRRGENEVTTFWIETPCSSKITITSCISYTSKKLNFKKENDIQ
jgi:hypothetical protein